MRWKRKEEEKGREGGRERGNMQKKSRLCTQKMCLKGTFMTASLFLLLAFSEEARIFISVGRSDRLD